MAPSLSNKILISVYCLLACWFLFASINNAVENLAGNRTLGASLALGYCIFMTMGLVNARRAFAVISSLSFFAGCLLVGYFIFLGLPNVNGSLVVVLFGGIAGLVLSLNSTRVEYG